MEAEKWTFNTHEARFEPPDTVWITFRGKTELEDVRWAAALYIRSRSEEHTSELQSQ